MKLKVNKVRLILLVGLFLLVGVSLPGQKTLAAGSASPVQVDKVDYYHENIDIINNGNTKIYFATDSDAARNDWDCIDTDDEAITTMDMSWMLPTTQNVLMIKGDNDPTVSRVVLKAQPTRLTVTINYTNMPALGSEDTIAPLLNIMSTEGTAVNPISYEDLEWKKGDNGSWEDAETLTTGMLEKFLVKGTTLYFRIKAVNDEGANPDGTAGRRFSEPVKVKIIRQTSTTVTGIDGERLTAVIKYGKEYRVTATDTNGDLLGASKDWIQVTDKAIKKLPLATMANGMLPAHPESVTGGAFSFDGIYNPFPAMTIEVRDFATMKTAASQTTTTSLEAQRTLDNDYFMQGPALPAADCTADNIFVNYFGDKYTTLTIPWASGNLPYEYTIVKPGAILNINTATWSVITKGTAVKLLAGKAPEGSTIYVRLKEIKARLATATTDPVSYQLASTVVSYIVKYPSAPVVKKDTLVYTKGYAKPQTITIQLNTAGKEPYETEVTSVKLGAKTIGFTPDIAPNATIDPSIANTLTLTLTGADLAAMTNCTNRFLTITFKNGTIDKSSVKLTVKNPTPAGSLTLSPLQEGTAGTTKLSVVSSLGANNEWVYKITTAAAPAGLNTEDTLDPATDTQIKSFVQGGNIPVSATQYITVYELDKDSHSIIKYRSLQITDAMIVK